MKVENGKIVEATENELFAQWLRSGFCDIMSFYEYKWRCEMFGTVIVADKQALEELLAFAEEG